MRGLICRGLRLELVTGLGILLAMPAWAATTSQATQTTLSAATSVQGGRTQTIVAVSVAGRDGSPVTGSVVIEDEGKSLAGVGLSAEGQARTVLSLPPGDHSLTAVYIGDQTHQASTSAISPVRAAATAAPDFQISVAPAALSLTPGQSGSAIVSVTPVNANALTAPMFVTLSCSGFPDQSSCTFTPENLEILPNATAPVTSSMVMTTQATSLAELHAPGHPRANSVAMALLLPGTLGLTGLAFATRRRRLLSRLSMVALVGFVSILGMTACAPRYNYYNHGPPYNLPTPAGTYTLLVTAQSSNGIIATTHSTNFVLTVK